MAYITQPPDSVTIYSDGTMTQHFGEPREGYYTEEEIEEHYRNSDWVKALKEEEKLEALIKKHPKKAAEILYKQM